MTKPAHYRGSFHVQSRRIRQAAYADPLTRCWRCGLMRHQWPTHKNGKPAWWEAGHIVAGNPAAGLRAECSICNRSHGAKHGNALRGLRRAAFKAVLETQKHTSTRW